MNHPAKVLVTLHRDDENGPARCMCSDVGPVRQANVRILVTATNFWGEDVPELAAAEWRCADGADSYILTLRQEMRRLRIPVTVEDHTGGYVTL